MASQRGSQLRPFECLGISEAEELVYRWLLQHPGATAQETARGLSQPPNKAQRLLDAIEDKGLASHVPERPRRYNPASPDMAMEALALKRQEELSRARTAIAELQQQTASRKPADHEQMVELITSPDAAKRILEQLSLTAKSEILCLMRPPILLSRTDAPPESGQAAQRRAQARGVRFRNIVDSEIMALPRVIEIVRSDMETGQEFRIIPELPFKVVLVDRRIALVPLNLKSPSGLSLLVRSSALLDALYTLFEVLWQQASPMSFLHDNRIEIGDSHSVVPEETLSIMQLLVAGLNDKSVVHQLGISRSTFTRRMGEVAKAWNVKTRFQLGWFAALRLAKGMPESEARKSDLFLQDNKTQTISKQ